MNVIIIGANGGIGRILSKQLSTNVEITPIALIRKESQKSYFEDINVETRMGDLEQSVDELANTFSGTDAVVFTAGSGGNTNHDKTLEIDLDGAVKCMEAAEQTSVKRFLLVSVFGADNRNAWNSSPIKPYMIAKHYADRVLKNSSLNYTIVRPGGLTDEAGTGNITTDPSSTSENKIPRQDVGSVLTACLENDHTIGKIFEFVSGDIQIEKAIQ